MTAGVGSGLGSPTGEQAALHVPDGTPAQLLPWLRGDVRPPARYSAPEGASAAAGREAVAVRRLTSVWQDGELGRLREATRILVEGVGRLGSGLTVRAQVENGALSYLLAADAPARALATAVRAAFEEAEVEELSRPVAAGAFKVGWRASARRALAGIPVGAGRASKVTLLERLMRSGAPDWSLTVGLAVARPDLLAARYLQLGQLRAKAEAAARRTTQVSGTTSQSEVDPIAEVVADLLAREADRTLRGLRNLAFVAEVWLEGPDESVDGLAAIACAALGGDKSTIFPIRALKAAPSGAPPAVLLLSEEVARITQPPATDVRGLPVTRWFPMDSEPEAVRQGGPRLRLATSLSGAPLDYPADALTSHAFVSGTTGSGKSSFLKALLHEVRTKAAGVTFLVIEPTKDEYQYLDVPGLTTWKLGAPGGRLRLNPLEVPAGTSLTTHVDLLLALFSSTFALFPPLPYVLEMALRRSYEATGWDFQTGRHRSGGEGLFPTLGDLSEAALATVDELGYSGEVLHNVSAALLARLGSLRHGVKGEVLDTDEAFDIATLLGRPTVVNLDLVANDREKAFLMGLILIRLWEARRGAASRSLVHLTVVEEAHRILREPRPSADGSGGEGGFAAETFANLLAEVRSAGEGLVIVDQSPCRLVRDVLTNTGLKVACRTLGPDDRKLLSEALNIEGAAGVLTALSNHEALVFWEGMDRPVRCRLAARHTSFPRPVATAPVGAAQSSRALADDRVARLAGALLRVRTPERSRLWHLLVARVEEVLADGSPPVPHARTAVLRAASGLARQRGWSRRERDARAKEALPGSSTGRAPGWPDESTCPCVGGPGLEECRVAEPIRGVARRFRQRHPGFDPTTVGLDDLLAILNPYVEEGLGTGGVATSLDRLGTLCLASQLARQVRPQPVARAFREQLWAQTAAKERPNHA